MDVLQHRFGFTLIELAIVLVIIGLIVGGVLTGRDLISAAGVRATLTQVEKFNTAVNTFRGKYGTLPGDMDAVTAANFGFKPRGPYAGQGDGNGLLEGNNTNTPGGNYCSAQSAGETILFWADLGAAKLIEGSFTAASATVPMTYNMYPVAVIPGNLTTDSYYPQAKIGQGDYLYVSSQGPNFASDGINYFGLSSVVFVQNEIVSNPGLTVRQAYAFDTKIDDGLPQSGRVIAAYQWYSFIWSGANDKSATPASSSTCYDNGNVANATQQYSLLQNGGSGMNCGLSFKFP